MKLSHYTTPRTTADCVWDNLSDPIERPPRRKRGVNYWRIVALTLAAVLAALFLTDTSEPPPQVEVKTRVVV